MRSKSAPKPYIFFRMRARRMRRRLFNAFAFACLAFALYLIAFSKDEPVQPTNQTAHVATGAKAVANNP
jgi:hypothetical protein